MKYELKHYMKPSLFILPALLIAGCDKKQIELPENARNGQTQGYQESVTTSQTTTSQTAVNNPSTDTARTNANTDRPLASNSSAEGMSSAQLLSRIHNANTMEIEMGKLAQQRGKANSVKSYGQTLQKDHASADKKVKALATKEKIKLTEPVALNEKEKELMEGHKQLMDQLQSLRGDAFDKAFISGMIQGHQDTIAILEASNAKDERVKSLISDLLPTMRNHSREATAISHALQF